MLREVFSEIRTNPRLRWGLGLMLGILWFYGVLELRDATRHKQEQYQATAQALSRVRVQVTQKEWLERVEPARLLKVELESRLWQASTSGLAQAAFHDWLNATLARAAVSRPAVTMTAVNERGGEAAATSGANQTASTLPEDIRKIQAKVEFDFNLQSFIDLATRMAGHDKLVGLDTLTIRKEPIPRVEMVAVAYFQKPAERSAQAGKRSGPLATSEFLSGDTPRQ